MATPTQALPLGNFETGPESPRGELTLNLRAVYTGDCPSAVERQAGPVFWQLGRVHVYAGDD